VDPAIDPLSGFVEEFIDCSGTFISSCINGLPYDFQFDPSIIVNLDLETGNSVNFLVGTFMPTGGAAPPGTYTFLNGGVFFEIFDNAFQDPGFSGFTVLDREHQCGYGPERLGFYA
jgi:hypothetical protein